MLLGLFLAILVGLSLGLFGGGGSILSVVILSFALGMAPKAAIAASLLVTGVSSSAALLTQRRSLLGAARIGIAFGGAGMLGAFAGGRLAALVPESVLLTAFGVVMLLTSIAMLTRHHRALESKAPGSGEQRTNERTSASTLRVVPLALSIGTVTGMLGAGGGSLIVPALVLHSRMPMKQAVATSLLVIALQSIAGFLGHVGESSLDWRVVVPFTLMATLGSVVGGVVAKRAPSAVLRRGFAVFILLVASVVLVRELPHAVKLSFPEHVHGGGEEFLVLQELFVDDDGESASTIARYGDRSGGAGRTKSSQP